jgi:putative SOS response-associated peptidase YedK
MSGQYNLTKEQEDILKKWVSEIGADLQNDEISINITSWNEWEKDKPFIEENIYVQVN